MTLQYLIDENVNPIYPNQIRLREPDITIKVVVESETPPKSTLDPEILYWCEDNNFILDYTNNFTLLVSKFYQLLTKVNTIQFTHYTSLIAVELH
jgi:hypothetical protein